jgi:hypothetical protein
MRQRFVFAAVAIVLCAVLVFESSFELNFIFHDEEESVRNYQPTADNCLVPNPAPDVHYTLFLLITTGWGPFNYIHRQIVRDTWLKEFCTNNNSQRASVGYAFVLGKPRYEIYSGLKKVIDEEIEKYQDLIVLQDFEDSYRNLSFKTLSSLKWATQNRHFEFLMKTDDDSVLNLRMIMDAVPTFQRTDFWMGNDHDAWHPWFTPGKPWTLVRSEVPKEDGLSDHLAWTNGFGYYMSKDVLKKVDSYLSNGTEDEWPKIYLEDVNTAMLLTKKLQIYPKSASKYGLKYDFNCANCDKVSVSHHCHFKAFVDCATKMMNAPINTPAP